MGNQSDGELFERLWVDDINWTLLGASVKTNLIRMFVVKMMMGLMNHLYLFDENEDCYQC